MTGFFPEHTVDKLRCTDFLITGIIQTITDIGFDLAIQLQTLVVPENRTLSFFLHVEQVHLAAKAAMIALFCFFQHVQIRIQVFLAFPASAIDTLQHFIVGIATPIGAGNLHQFEGLADLAGRGRMRAAAQVDEITLTIAGDGLIFRQVFDDFGFVLFAFLKEELDGFVAIPDFAHNRLIPLDDLVHLLFDLDQIVGRKWRFAGKVVIETIFDGRANCDLRIGIKFLNGFGHHVCAIVTDQRQNLFMALGHDFDSRVSVNLAREVAHFAVDDDGKGLLCQRRTDAFGDIEPRYRAVKFAYGTIGKGQGNHGWLNSALSAGIIQ